MAKRQIRASSATVRVSAGRPRSDLKDVNKDETYSRVPSVTSVEGMLLNNVAKDLYKESAAVLVKRQQLKPSHMTLLINYCNAFAVTVMSPDELIEHQLCFRKDDGSLSPSVNTVYSTYYSAMLRSMQNLRLDPKTELMNCLIAKAKEGGSTYIDKAEEVVGQL